MKAARLFAQLISSSLLVFAAPAMAGARVEGRVGVLSEAGQSVTIGGIAAGYDFDLPVPVFVGGEVSIDNTISSLNNGSGDLFVGLSARAGIRTGLGGRAYVTAGATLRTIDNSPYHAGVGYQQSVGPKLYLKAEYRHYFATGVNDNGDVLMGGLGFKF